MRARRILVVTLAALACAACGADSPAAGGTDTRVTAGSDAAAKAGDALLGGGTVDVTALSFQKPVALWFWAPG